MAKREYFYFPDYGTKTNWGLRFVIDSIRGELIFAVFSDEEKARAWVPDKDEPFIWRKTWKQSESIAKDNNCVGMILDPKLMEGRSDSKLQRDRIQYLEKPKQSAHHYLQGEGKDVAY